MVCLQISSFGDRIFYEKTVIRCSLIFMCAEYDRISLSVPAKMKVLDGTWINTFYGEFDPGSERTLAAWIRHASRTELLVFPEVEWRKGE